MARPVNADAQKTRARILDAAARLFSANGPDAVSIRDLSAAAGVSLAMVHHYFGSKDELYQATVDAMYEEMAELRAELARLLPAHDLASLLDVALPLVFRFAREHQQANRFVMREILATGELPERRRTEALLPFLATIESLVPAEDARARAGIRLAAQSVVFVVTRYALATVDEMARIAGLPPPGGNPHKVARVLSVIEGHLVEVARNLIAPYLPKKEEPCPPSPSSPAPRRRPRR